MTEPFQWRVKFDPGPVISNPLNLVRPSFNESAKPMSLVIAREAKKPKKKNITDNHHSNTGNGMNWGAYTGEKSIINIASEYKRVRKDIESRNKAANITAKKLNISEIAANTIHKLAELDKGFEDNRSV